MTRQYIQRIAKRLAIRYRSEVGELAPGPAQRLLVAAEALDGFVNQGESLTSHDLTAALEQAKDCGTVGYEMWLAGREWMERYVG